MTAIVSINRTLNIEGWVVVSATTQKMVVTNPDTAEVVIIETHSIDYGEATELTFRQES